jgi:hypothetical protein
MLTTPYADSGLRTATPGFPIISATAVMIFQLALDLYECVGAAWALVATRSVHKLQPLCVFGNSPDLDASLRCSASMLGASGNIIDLKSTAGVWMPQIVAPTFVRNEMAGALIFGPKTLKTRFDQHTPAAMPSEYTFEEKQLVEEFAHHISKLLRKDPRAGNR